MRSVAEIQQIISKKINGFCEKNGSGQIYVPINYMLSLGGKRVRPTLSLMAANLFDDEIDQAIYPAIAVEIFHNFTLMHDDIMDKSPMRRGQQTVHEKWSDDVAILSGDAMMIQSYQLLIKTKTEVLAEVMGVFNRTALEVCEGQQQDMDFEKRDNVALEEYLEMIRLKTSVLVAGGMKIGALINGADQNSQQHIYDFGENLGIAFQLQDDYLDAYGDTDKTGKQKGGDIISGKKTFLLVRALEKASEPEREALKALLASSLAPALKVKSVMEIFTRLGVDEELTGKARAYHDKALASLEAVNVADERKIDLRLMAEALLGREQ